MSRTVSRDEFYAAKDVVRVEWWLHGCDLPDKLSWARLRVFSDGTADACFGEHGVLYGFDDEENAGYLLSEDEYVRVSGWNDEDERSYGVRLTDLTPPRWDEQANQDFEYRGAHF